MHIKFSGKLKSTKPGVEFHGDKRAVRTDLSIQASLGKDSLVELLGTGSEQVAETLWNSDGRAAQVIGSAKNELSLDPAVLIVDADVISAEAVSIDGVASKFAFEVKDGYQVDVTMQYSATYAKDVFDYLIVHATQVKDKPVVFTLEGKQVELQLTDDSKDKNDENPTAQLDLDDSAQAGDQVEVTVTKSKKKESNKVVNIDDAPKANQRPTPPPPPVAKNVSMVEAALNGLLQTEAMTFVDEALFDRFVDELRRDHKDAKGNIFQGPDNNLVVQQGKMRALHITPVIDGESDYIISGVINVSGKLHDYDTLVSKMPARLLVARFITDYLGEEPTSKPKKSAAK